MLGFAIHEKPTIGLLRLESLLDQLLEEAVALNDVPSGMTFTRGTSGWDPYNGVIDAPAVRRRRAFMPGRRRVFEFDLIEGAGTNLLAAGASEFVSGWGTSAATLSAQSAVAPDGTMTAATLTDTSANSQHKFTISVPNMTASNTYTCSLYLKANSLTWAALQVTTISDSFPFAYINLSTGAVGTTSGSPTVQIQNAGNGWWRLCVTVAMATGGTTPALTIYLANANNSSSYVGTGQSIYAWGCDSILSGYPVSYISNRNLLTYSNTTTNAAWTKTNATTADNNATDPNGNLTASTLTLTTTAGLITRTVTVTASTAYVFSWWAKAGTATTPTYLIYDATHSANIKTATYTPTSGWVRQSIAFTTPSGCTSIKLYQVDGATGAGTILLWNAQLEYGTAATSDWVVDATVGIRDADNLTSTYAIGTGAGTMLGLMIPNGWTTDTGGSANFFADSTAGNVMQTYVQSSGLPLARRTDSNGVQAAGGPSGVTPVNGVLFEAASVYGSSTLRCYSNGSFGGSNTTTPPYTASAGQQIGGSQGNGNPAYAWVLVLYWPRALSAQELLTLASICTGKVAA